MFNLASFREAEVLATERQNCALDTRQKIEKEYGSIESFRKSLTFESILSEEEYARLADLHKQQTNDAGKEIDAFFHEVDRRLRPHHKVLTSGILPEELFPRADFTHDLVHMNFNKAFAETLGPYRHSALVLKDKDKKVIGASVSLIFCNKEGPATLQTSYVALLPKYRALGLGKLMQKAIAEHAISYVQQARPNALDQGYLLHFIEANDISKMTLEGRLKDQAFAIHPIDRDIFWERQGFREIGGINYHQRSQPPIPLALKAQEIEVKFDGEKGYTFAGVRAPEKVHSEIVRRHVSGVDNLLVNFLAMLKRLHDGKPLLDPCQEGLLTLPVRPEPLKTITPEAAKQFRQDWKCVDQELNALQKQGASLDPSTPMAQLRNTFLGYSPSVLS